MTSHRRGTSVAELGDPQLLAKIQRAATDTLAELDRVCHELDIRYVVYGGSAIGTVRHQGFIPWDDDVDVCMPREGYERFLREAPPLLAPEFEVVSQLTHPDYPRPFGVLGIVGSVFTPSVARNRAFQVPLGIDLFPLDRIPKDRRAFKRQSAESWVWGRLMFLHGTPTPDTGLTGPAKTLAKAVFHATHQGLKVLHVSASHLYRQWEKVATRYNNTGSPVLGDYCTQDPLRWSAREDELFPSIRMPFGDIEVEVARKFDAVLTRGYGDYMNLPPEDQRVNHAAVEVSFGVWQDPEQ